MPQLFRPYADTVARLVLAAIPVLSGLAIGIPYWVMRSDYITGDTVTRDQPVPFSHAHHVGGLGIDCRYCHTAVENSAVASIPATHICMTCHSELYTQTAMLAPVRESLVNQQPIHWNKVNRLPDYVYFDHSIHVANGVGCTTCHGDIASMPLMRQAAPLTMGWCINCHRDPAPYLRPAASVFDPYWTAPADQTEKGRTLAHALIDNQHLTDCSVCHR